MATEPALPDAPTVVALPLPVGRTPDHDASTNTDDPPEPVPAHAEAAVDAMEATPTGAEYQNGESAFCPRQ